MLLEVRRSLLSGDGRDSTQCFVCVGKSVRDKKVTIVLLIALNSNYLFTKTKVILDRAAVGNTLKFHLKIDILPLSKSHFVK